MSTNQSKKQNKQNKTKRSKAIRIVETLRVKARPNPRVRKAKRDGGFSIMRNGPVRGLNYMATDGINSSRVVTNTSVVEDRFQIRREKIANISGTSAFTLASQLYINPGNTTLFPIFSQIAATYEQYRVNHLRFTFETDAYTATNGTASAGKVILATNFDPDDSNFSGDTQMENYWHSVKGPPYAPIISHDVLAGARGGSMRDAALKNYYVYSSGNSLAPVTGEGKFYDFGNFQVATSGNAVTTEIGELYVEYSFTMIHPKQSTPLGQQLISGRFTAVGTISATAPLGTSLTTVAGSNFVVTASTTNLTMPANLTGRFLFAYSTAGTTLVPSANFSAGTGSTAVAAVNNAGCVNAVATLGISWAVFDCTSSSVIGLPTFTSATNTSAYISISQISSGLSLSSPSVQDELQVLKAQVAALSRMRVTCDSDFDDEEHVGSSSIPPGGDSLSRSTLDVIGEIIARKSTSHKKA